MRKAKLRELRKLGQPPTSKQITGYQVAAEALWRAQHYKCCYCEMKIKQAYNDVEHYRPKAHADRLPGSTDTHGYWWLAYTWNNLLFACPSCNRSDKNDQFPLAPGDTALHVHQQPPGLEHPYLLDPAKTNPVEHIQYFLYQKKATKQWRARARARSAFGSWTIKVCGLNDQQDLLELRFDHVEGSVLPRVHELQEALASRERPRVHAAFMRALGLLDPRRAHVALSYDALQHFVPARELVPWKKSWPTPDKVPGPHR